MGEETRHLTPDQVTVKLRAVDAETSLRIERFLVNLSYAGMDAGDISNEVWAQIYEGRRKCPVDVDPMAFFHESARSIVSQQYGKETRLREGMARMQADPSMLQPLAPPDPETVLIDMERQEQLTNWVYDKFSNDDDALLYLEMRLHGQTSTEIKIATGWDDTKFETIRRRVARHVKR